MFKDLDLESLYGQNGKTLPSKFSLCALGFPSMPYCITSHLFSSFPLQLHLVALNTPFSGDMRADYQCFQQARAAGLTSTYRAFLSSHLQDLLTVVRKTDRYHLPIVNLKDEILFDNWEAIFSGKGGQFDLRIPIYSFDGRNVFTDPAWYVYLHIFNDFPCICTKMGQFSLFQNLHKIKPSS
uniref:Collagenase NC10/endostatin domain-containing protein n=1 Tax=Anolis carolinensis TaxID=28377 RepID=A0A803TBU5_ANOCA